MTLKQRMAVGGAAIVVATAMWFGLNAPEQKPHKIPKDKISDMGFPKGLKVKGDPMTGSLCHQLVGPDGEVWKFHRITDKDFRKMTEEEIKAAIIADTQADLEEAGVACGPAAPSIFSEALADIKRCDGCGTDCWATSCPATYIGPHCTLDGTTCVITFICCGSSGGCPVSCEQ